MARCCHTGRSPSLEAGGGDLRSGGLRRSLGGRLPGHVDLNLHGSLLGELAGPRGGVAGGLLRPPLAAAGEVGDGVCAKV